MNERATANRLLDQLKDGGQFSRVDIDRALTATGDIETDRCAGMDQEIPQESDGGGESRGISMVAENLVRLSEAAWESRN